MSSLLIQVLILMACAFIGGLALGWAIWRFNGSSKKALDSMSSEMDFWRANLDQCRIELGEAQNAAAALRQEKARLKQQLTIAQNAKIAKKK